MSPAVVEVPETDWTEPALVWLAINIPTGSTKSALYHYLHSIILQVRAKCRYTSRDPAYVCLAMRLVKNKRFNGTNGGCLLGLYENYPLS